MACSHSATPLRTSGGTAPASMSGMPSTQPQHLRDENSPPARSHVCQDHVDTCLRGACPLHSEAVPMTMGDQLPPTLMAGSLELDAAAALQTVHSDIPEAQSAFASPFAIAKTQGGAFAIGPLFGCGALFAVLCASVGLLALRRRRRTSTIARSSRQAPSHPRAQTSTGPMRTSTPSTRTTQRPPADPTAVPRILPPILPPILAPIPPPPHEAPKCLDEESLLSRLPPDLLIHTFSLLPTKDLAALAAVSQSTRATAEDDALWKARFFARYGGLCREVFPREVAREDGCDDGHVDGHVGWPQDMRDHPGDGAGESCAGEAWVGPRADEGWKPFYFWWGEHWGAEVYARTSRILIQVGSIWHDVTDFKEDHPGDPNLLLSAAGTDASGAYGYVGHSQHANRLLAAMALPQLELAPEGTIASVKRGAENCTARQRDEGRSRTGLRHGIALSLLRSTNSRVTSSSSRKSFVLKDYVSSVRGRATY